MVIAAGSVIKEPNTGPRVRMVNHQAVSVPPSRLAIFHMICSVNFKMGRVDARVIITTTKMGSEKLTR